MPTTSHDACFICGPHNPHGLRLEFHKISEIEVHAQVIFPQHMCGYPERIQGGIVSAVLDSAMANVFLLQSRVAYTARLELRYLHPVLPGCSYDVRGSLIKSQRNLHTLRAELLQANKVIARAEGVFFEPYS